MIIIRNWRYERNRILQILKIFPWCLPRISFFLVSLIALPFTIKNGEKSLLSKANSENLMLNPKSRLQCVICAHVLGLVQVGTLFIFTTMIYYCHIFIEKRNISINLLDIFHVPTYAHSNAKTNLPKTVQNLISQKYLLSTQELMIQI